MYYVRIFVNQSITPLKSCPFRLYLKLCTIDKMIRNILGTLDTRFFFYYFDDNEVCSVRNQNFVK